MSLRVAGRAFARSRANTLSTMPRSTPQCILCEGASADAVYWRNRAMVAEASLRDVQAAVGGIAAPSVRSGANEAQVADEDPPTHELPTGLPTDDEPHEEAPTRELASAEGAYVTAAAADAEEAVEALSTMTPDQPQEEEEEGMASDGIQEEAPALEVEEPEAVADPEAVEVEEPEAAEVEDVAAAYASMAEELGEPRDVTEKDMTEHEAAPQIASAA